MLPEQSIARFEETAKQHAAGQEKPEPDFTAVNNEIGSARWTFRCDRLEELRRKGLEMTDANLATINVAQRRFVADSPRLQRFIQRYRSEGAAAPRFVDRTREPARPPTVRAS